MPVKTVPRLSDAAQFEDDVGNSKMLLIISRVGLHPFHQVSHAQLAGDGQGLVQQPRAFARNSHIVIAKGVRTRPAASVEVMG